MNQNEKRCTRGDREKAADLLGQHYAAGSLDDEEYQERLDAAMKAKYPSELAALLADLPDLPVPAVPPEMAWKPARPLAPAPFWSPEHWVLQNAVAAIAALGLTAMVGATTKVNLYPLALILCGILNGALGFRKSARLGIIGCFSGLFICLGTLLMIILTWRRKAARPSRA